MDSPDILVLAEISFLFLVCNIVLTFSVVYYRRYRHKILKNLEIVFADQVSAFLYPLPGEKITTKDITKALRKAGVKEYLPVNIQYLIQLMISTQSALGGKNHFKIKRLYHEIPPYGASIAKVRSKKWYKMAMGIREIYEMDQSRYFKEIAPYYDHQNTYVRQEAQIAMVVFLGWKSMRFLPYLKQRISLWQQIKIVEKLHDTDKSFQILYLRNCYESPNDDILQLVIRVIKKYKIMSELDFLIKQLGHSSYEVREAAIYCLLSLGVLNPEMRQQLYNHRTSIPCKIQQAQVLKYLYKNPDFISNNAAIALGFYKSA